MYVDMYSFVSGAEPLLTLCMSICTVLSPVQSLYYRYVCRYVQFCLQCRAFIDARYIDMYSFVSGAEHLLTQCMSICTVLSPVQSLYERYVCRYVQFCLRYRTFITAMYVDMYSFVSGA